MAEETASPLQRQPLPWKKRAAGALIVGLMRTVCASCRFRLEDRAGITGALPDKPMIWLIWHNRIFAIIPAYLKYLPSRRGASLTSASGDGDYIAATVEAVGVSAVRGSSSRRGAAALLGLVDWVKRGFDVLIVPDGPRGPRYRMGPGVVKLAQVTGASVLPIRIEYGSAWKFQSWDRFRLPKPFTTVTVIFEPLVDVPSELDEEAFEETRQSLERTLNPENETD